MLTARLWTRLSAPCESLVFAVHPLIAPPRGAPLRQPSALPARGGLAARGKLNDAGDNETGYLQPLDEIVATGKTPAERLLDLYHGTWGGTVEPIYEAKSF